MKTSLYTEEGIYMSITVNLVISNAAKLISFINTNELHCKNQPFETMLRSDCLEDASVP